jgi:hypothetical protein
MDIACRCNSEVLTPLEHSSNSKMDQNSLPNHKLLSDSKDKSMVSTSFDTLNVNS